MSSTLSFGCKCDASGEAKDVETSVSVLEVIRNESHHTNQALLPQHALELHRVVQAESST
jgi:hypothetical protein